MRNQWQPIKDREAFAKGRHALRGDYLAGSYSKCAFASFVTPKTRAGKEYAAAKKREERGPTQVALNEVFVAIGKLDEKRKVKRA